MYICVYYIFELYELLFIFVEYILQEKSLPLFCALFVFLCGFVVNIIEQTKKCIKSVEKIAKCIKSVDFPIDKK